MKSLHQFWTPRRMGSDRVSLARLGILRIWMARADREWGYAIERGEDPVDIVDWANVPNDVVPADIDWQHVAFQEAPHDYQLSPAVPDRPVVIKPPHPVIVPDGERTTFFVLLPASIELKLLQGKQEFKMERIPTRLMSDTWFGSQTEGVLCYSLAFKAERELESLSVFPHHIVCPIDVINRSKEHLKFEKLCLRTKHLSIYGGSRHLWSSRVEISQEGRFKTSNVTYSKKAPEFEANITLLRGPEEEAERGISRLTFSSGYKDDFIHS